MGEMVEFFFIGYAGEINARRKPIDISDLIARWPEATPTLMVNRPKEDAPYPAETTIEGSVLYWEVSDIDVAKSGFGQAQVYMRAEDGALLGKSEVINTLIKNSLNGAEQENPPPAVETWVTKMLDASEEMKKGYILKNQGTEHAGKVLGIGPDGILTPMEYEAGTGGVSIDTTLTQSGKAADAAAVGEKLNGLNEANAAQDEEIAKRAKDADLAAVAKSGSYNDLKNTPTFPTVPDSLKNPNKLKLTGAVTAEYDGSEEVSVEIPTGGSEYTLPVATSEVLGGVKAPAATDDMTQQVGIKEDGTMWVPPGGSSGYELLMDVTLEEEAGYVVKTFDNPTSYTDFYIMMSIVGVQDVSWTGMHWYFALAPDYWTDVDKTSMGLSVYTSATPTVTRYYVGHIKVTDGMVYRREFATSETGFDAFFSHNSNSAANLTKTEYQNARPLSSITVISGRTIKGICVRHCRNSPAGVGSTFRVWGVRG